MSSTARPGKYIEALSPEMEPAQAARLVLEARLGVVEDLLPIAAQKGSKDPEYVHQLRVGSRRAAAALDAFSACLPRSHRQVEGKRLRRIRRSAGEARSCDVQSAQLTRLLETATAYERLAIGYMLGRFAALRQTAQEHVSKVSERYPRRKLRKKHQKLLNSLGRETDDSAAERPATVGEVSTPILRRRLEAVRQAASADLAEIDAAHQLRIEGKRLRYSLELFRCCFDESAFQSLYSLMTEVQDMLGILNDHHDLHDRIAQFAGEFTESDGPSRANVLGASLVSLAQSELKRRDDAHRTFVQWWQERGFARLRERLDAVLKSNGEAAGTDLAADSSSSVESGAHA